jgi:hypothetical protein
MHEPTYDIFSGAIDNQPLWLESVQGLDTAREHMKKRSEEKPGHYFLFSYATNTVLALIDNSDSEQPPLV